MISVCMATCNGEKYIRPQLDSILQQLGPEDEIIISDDDSKDRTIEIITSYNDPRIHLLHAHFKSPIFNFENALKQATGDYIFLSDQDDIWLEGRVEKTIGFMQQNHSDLVVCKCEVTDANGNTIRESFFNDKDPVAHSWWHNLLKNPYMGCCMAFTQKILIFALPFPKKIAMHDSWIGLIAQMYFTSSYYDKPLLKYRRHSVNETNDLNQSPYSLGFRIRYRMYLLWMVLLRGTKINHRIC